MKLDFGNIIDAGIQFDTYVSTNKIENFLESLRDGLSFYFHKCIGDRLAR